MNIYYFSLVDIGEFLLLLSPYSQTSNIMSILYICHTFCLTAKPCCNISQFLWILVLLCVFKIILYLISSIYHSSFMQASLLQFTEEFLACFSGWICIESILMNFSLTYLQIRNSDMNLFLRRQSINCNNLIILIKSMLHVK